MDILKKLLPSLGLTLLCFLVGVRFPLSALLLFPLALYPPLALAVRHGPRMGMGVVLLALLFLYGAGDAGLVAGYSVLAALMLPLVFLSGRSIALELRVIGSAAAGVAASFGLLLLWFGSSGELYGVLGEILSENVAASLAFYSNIGFSEQDIERLREHIPGIVKLVLGVMPSLAFVAFATVVLLNLVILGRRFPAERPWLLSHADLREWKSAEPIVWLFVGSGFFYLLVPHETLGTAALNLFIVSLAFYFFQGLAIMSYYFHHKKVPVFLRGLGYTLLALEQIMMLAVVGLGLFDVWMDFRGLNKKGPLPTEV